MAQDRVYQSRGRSFACLLHQFNGLRDGGVVRDAVHVAQLIRPEPQGGQHFGIHGSHGPARLGGDQMVKFALPPQASKHCPGDKGLCASAGTVQPPRMQQLI